MLCIQESPAWRCYNNSAKFFFHLYIFFVPIMVHTSSFHTNKIEHIHLFIKKRQLSLHRSSSCTVLYFCICLLSFRYNYSFLRKRQCGGAVMDCVRLTFYINMPIPKHVPCLQLKNPFFFL